MKWLLLIAGILANASASVLIKFAVEPPFKFPSLKDPLAALSNWPLWLGLALYGTAFLLYAAVLTRLPLNIAQPVLTAGTITLIALSSLLIFREPFHWMTGLGIALILIGVVVLTSLAPAHD